MAKSTFILNKRVRGVSNSVDFEPTPIFIYLFSYHTPIPHFPEIIGLKTNKKTSTEPMMLMLTKLEGYAQG